MTVLADPARLGMLASCQLAEGGFDQALQCWLITMELTRRGMNSMEQFCESYTRRELDDNPMPPSSKQMMIFKYAFVEHLRPDFCWYEGETAIA